MRDGEPDGPFCGVGLWVVNSQLVIDRVVGNPREALRQLRILTIRNSAAIGPDSQLAVKIGGLDNQCLPFPVAYRVSHIGVNARGEMRPAVERNDASVVNHLVTNGDES